MLHGIECGSFLGNVLRMIYKVPLVFLEWSFIK